jgi:three-Cys-motif partner protein
VRTRLCSSKCRPKDGNCYRSGSDGFPVQCVGPWAKHKYWVLERYLEATYGVRQKFSVNGNSVYIDLFAGPGLCIIRDELEEIDGGCLRVVKYPKAPFNQHYFVDSKDTNIAALKKRMPDGKEYFFDTGDSNLSIHDIVGKLSKQDYKYHFAYVDPFGPEGLKFSTIEALSRLSRIDLLIHFPIGPIRRNIPHWREHDHSTLDEFLGTSKWREKLGDLRQGRTLGTLLDIYKEQLIRIGFPEEGLSTKESDNLWSNLPAVSIRNTVEGELYVLVLASKHGAGQRIWSSSIKVAPGGQGRLL